MFQQGADLVLATTTFEKILAQLLLALLHKKITLAPAAASSRRQERR